MPNFFAKVIADSITPYGIRGTTIHARYWRAIHAEFMTHRVMSRNARSSRAVPTTTLLSEEPFVPMFLENKPGMQGGAPLIGEAAAAARQIWLDLVEHTRAEVAKLHQLNVHKQYANRPLEWFGWIDVLITTTEWDNFLGLRIHSAAQPEIEILARQILTALNSSTPTLIEPGDWHLPYVLPEERHLPLDTQQKLSVARCARISYVPFDGEPAIEKEFERYERLLGSSPLHASPAEHQFTPDTWYSLPNGQTLDGQWNRPSLHGNLTGVIQYRKTLANEKIALYPDLIRHGELA